MAFEHWTKDQYPLKTLEKVPMEDKILLARKEELHRLEECFQLTYDEINEIITEAYSKVPRSPVRDPAATELSYQIIHLALNKVREKLNKEF